MKRVVEVFFFLLVCCIVGGVSNSFGQPLLTFKKNDLTIFVVGSAHSSVRELPKTLQSELASAIHKKPIVLFESIKFSSYSLRFDELNFPEVSISNLQQDCFVRTGISKNFGAHSYKKWTRASLSMLFVLGVGRYIHAARKMNPLLSNLSPDKLMMDLFEKNSLLVKPIETEEQVLGVFRESQLSDVLEAINSFCAVDLSSHTTKKIEDLYKKVEISFADSNFDAVYNGNVLMYEILGLGKIYKTTVLQERNKIFLQSIMNELKSNPNVLAVVGAAHVGGNSGMVELLNKNGFVLEK